MRQNYILSFLLYFFSFIFFGAEYKVSNADEISKLKLAPGDKVLLKNGEWSNQRLILKGVGNDEMPIHFKAEENGKVILSGTSSIRIEGKNIWLEGIAMKLGYSDGEKDLIEFANSSNNCRLFNSFIDSYNNPDVKIDYKWVSVKGKNNRVDHCSFIGKSHQGTLLVVWLTEINEPLNHHIDHNYFGKRPALGANGGEIIRIGTSEFSMNEPLVKIENNIFDNCDGEAEIVSIKSCKNIIKNNLFYECDGTLTLRHGNNNEVSGNYFIGNGKSNTGGVRVIAENHLVFSNYFQGLKGTNLRSAISVMNGVSNSKLNEYFPAKQIKIKNNFIIDCKEGIVIGSGRNETRVIPPNDIVVESNYLINNKLSYQKKENLSNVITKTNEVRGDDSLIGTDGFDGAKTKFFTKNKLWFVKEKEADFKLFWQEEKIGTDWESHQFEFKIN